LCVQAYRGGIYLRRGMDGSMDGRRNQVIYPDLKLS
jgi:hypothetical protein